MSGCTGFFWFLFLLFQFSSVAQSCPTLCDPWIAARQASLSITNSRSSPKPMSQWCHPAISSIIVPFSSCPQSLPASGSFPMSQLFAWGGQSISVSALASVLPMNTQDWSPLGWTGWIYHQIKHTLVFTFMFCKTARHAASSSRENKNLTKKSKYQVLDTCLSLYLICSLF